MSSLRSRADFDSYWPPSSAADLDARKLSSDKDLRQRFDTVVRKRSLTRTIKSEIIPRLLLAHRQPETAAWPSPSAKVDCEDVAEFARLLMARDPAIALEFVHTKRSQGASLDDVIVDLFAPTARHLGDLWAEDFCSFADVTIALSRLQKLLRELAPEFDPPHARERTPRVLLAAMPGEQHTFGISIVQEFFRRAGCEVLGGHFSSVDELIGSARSGPLDLIGLSVSRDLALEDLASTIRNIRSSATNPTVKIVVGGRFFLDHPELVACTGADATAPDGRHAVGQLSSLLDTSAMRY
jgi:methanogenic corrinoid protein MtbC1